MPVIRAMISRLRRDEGGYMVVEAVLVLPMLLWAFLALYSFWDAYRAATTIQKATYSISDLISREQQSVNPAFIAGMRTAMDQMIPPRLDTELRVTSIVRNETEERFEVQWSCVAGTPLPTLTTETLQALVTRIPAMSDGNTVILVETWVDYDPALDIGVTNKRVAQFVVTRPRYQPRIALTGSCT